MRSIRVVQAVLLLVPQPQPNADTHGQSPTNLKGLRRREWVLEGGFESGRGIGKGQGRGCNQVSRPSPLLRTGPMTTSIALSCTSPTPTRIPLLETEARRFSLAKTEPWRLDFWFPPKCLPPHHPKPNIPHSNQVLSARNRGPLHIVRQNW
jgi:hypothetical protein